MDDYVKYMSEAEAEILAEEVMEFLISPDVLLHMDDQTYNYTVAELSDLLMKIVLAHEEGRFGDWLDERARRGEFLGELTEKMKVAPYV